MDRGKRERLLNEAARGYRRLAFGPVADAVRLMLAEGPEGERPEGPMDWDRLDLFNLAEVRRGKGTMEMRFVSRLEALDRLVQLARDEGAGDEDSFYAALSQGAKAFYRGKEDAGAGE